MYSFGSTCQGGGHDEHPIIALYTPNRNPHPPFFVQAAGGLKNDFECDDQVINDQTIDNLLSRN